MNAAIRNIQLVAVVVVLISTIVAFLLEIVKMYEAQNVTLADLLLMFIYIEVIGLVRSYWESRAVRVISFSNRNHSTITLYNIAR